MPKLKRDHVLRIKVTLLGVKPPVWRRILVPCDYTFWDLHVAIQDAMGWTDIWMPILRSGPGSLPSG